jgi:hypothetical protein
MEVNIGDMVSTVRAVDDSTLLAPRTLERIIEVVLRAVREREEHQARVNAEQRVTGGVRAEMEAEED